MTDPRPGWPRLSSPSAPRANLGVMSAAFTVFGLSLLLQPHRWGATPAYAVLLQIFRAQTWGALFLASGVSMGLACWQFQRRWLVIAALTLAFMLTNMWTLAFVVRYLTNADTTPVTWVSWGVFDYLLARVALAIDFVSKVPPPPPVQPGPLPGEPGPMAIAEAREALWPPPER